MSESGGGGRDRKGEREREGEQVEKRTTIAPCAYPEKFDVV